MKPSHYNHKIPLSDKVLYFNLVTERFFMIPASREMIYDAIIQEPDRQSSSFSDLVLLLKDNGFIIEEHENETVKISTKYHTLLRPWEYRMMVLPTYQCNLRCNYCIQNHSDTWMSDEIAEKVKKRIKRVLEDNTIIMLTLSWFGGEPMLAYNRLLEITRFAKSLAVEYGKAFYAGITTNGSLLNSKRIEELRNYGVSHYQITIDGKKEIHDQVKALPYCSSFNRTLENVNHISQHTSCTLRFNYTHKNLHVDEIINDLNSHLSMDSRKNIRFLICKVWQEDDKLVDEKEVKRLFDEAKRIGLTPAFTRTGLCYADQMHFECIFPNGKVGKCDNADLDQKEGILTEDASVEWIGDIRMHLRVYENKNAECNTCKYMPFCWGPCVARREEMIKSHGHISCIYADRKKEIDRLILNYCHNSLALKGILL